MGHSAELGQTGLEARRFELFRGSLKGTVETMFKEGAAVSQDGTAVYFSIGNFKLPDQARENFENGRTFTVFPQELGINVSPNNSKTSRLHVIPPDSNKHLTYTVGRKGGIAIRLLYGIDDNNQPIDENLEGTKLMRGLQSLARKKMINLGIEPRKYRPTQVLGECLREIADAQFEGGLGEYNQAVVRLKVQKQTAEVANTFLQNGK